VSVSAADGGGFQQFAADLEQVREMGQPELGDALVRLPAVDVAACGGVQPADLVQLLGHAPLAPPACLPQASEQLAE
jgi:hypothetical protein